MKGVLVDLLTEVFQNILGYHVIHEGYPWVRAQEMVKTGEMDGFCIVATLGREKYTIFAETPVLQSPILIATSSNSPKKEEILSTKTIKGLSKYQISSYRGNGFVAMN
ncbi:hypothetical protein JCM14722_22780 [Pseudodesulfovibrio portus]|uniref:Uncharacterized protein n=1 Tax=Pseudodesulfovibrio portus TaxID=231439 RepID=A0ABN6RUL8_9BACT|nr:hypothetical protein JCM14722_22780 [Pseudodesulfovibrio portus]